MSDQATLLRLRAQFAIRLKNYRDGKPCSDGALAFFVSGHASLFFAGIDEEVTALQPSAPPAAPRSDPDRYVDLGAMVATENHAGRGVVPLHAEPAEFRQPCPLHPQILLTDDDEDLPKGPVLVREPLELADGTAQ